MVDFGVFFVIDTRVSIVTILHVGILLGEIEYTY